MITIQPQDKRIGNEIVKSGYLLRDDGKSIGFVERKGNHEPGSEAWIKEDKKAQEKALKMKLSYQKESKPLPGMKFVIHKGKKSKLVRSKDKDPKTGEYILKKEFIKGWFLRGDNQKYCRFSENKEELLDIARNGGASVNPVLSDEDKKESLKQKLEKQ